MIYKFTSSDLGAVQVSGTVGSLINAILDPCLVNGFGSVSVSSMVRAGSVVTVTTATPHGFYYAGSSLVETASVCRIEGASETEYNGDWKVASIISPSEFTFDIGLATPASPATGTITSKRAPLGWIKAFSGTNKAAYRMPAGTTQHYLRVDDNAPTGGDAKCAAIRGFETMADVDTGTQPFPSIAQSANGDAIAKSDALSAAVRNWYLISDGFFVWLGIAGVNGSFNFNLSGFGEYPTFKAGDAYNTAIAASPTVTPTFSTANTGIGSGVANGPTSPTGGAFGARSYNQLGSSVTLGIHGANSFSSTFGAGGFTYPSPVDNGIYLSPLTVMEAATGLPRGMWPGLLQVLHNRPLAGGDTVENVIGLEGKTVQAWLSQTGNSANIQHAFDITGPWR